MFNYITKKINTPKRDIRLFALETANKSGKMNPPVDVGLYTSEYDKKTNLPRRPTTKELNYINALEKRVNYYVVPLITEDKIDKGQEKPHINQLKKTKRNVKPH